MIGAIAITARPTGDSKIKPYPTQKPTSRRYIQQQRKYYSTSSKIESGVFSDTPLNQNFVTGFTDGEGCFIVRIINMVVK